jgi:hypothetical protein
MLYLLNNVVVSTRESVPLPPGLEPLRRLTPAGVLKAGEELYARHPRLERERPDIAEWFCALLAARFPAANAALFGGVDGTRGIGACVAEVPLPVLARLWRFQREGDRIADEVFRDIWSRAKRVA